MKGNYSWVDAHLHLDLYPENERIPLLEETFRAGTSAVVGVSLHMESCRINRELAQRYPGRVLPAYGFHPEQPVPSREEEEALLRWIRERHESGEAFAIGEVGLPYYTRTEAEKAGTVFEEAPYLRLLERFAALAVELDRPIVLHAVYEDADKACAVLEKYGVKRAHFHWFKGAADTVRRMRDSGYRISITPDVSYEPEIQELVRFYPIELMMVETDGPWPFEGPYQGIGIKPAMAADVVRRIAEIKGMEEEPAANAILAGTKAFYGLP